MNNDLPQNLQADVNNRESKERTIYAVEEAAVTGQERAAVLYAGAALHRGFREIAELAGRVGRYRDRHRLLN